MPLVLFVIGLVFSELISMPKAGPLDLYGKEEDAPGLHESPTYGWNSRSQHDITGRISSKFEYKGHIGGRVPRWIQRPRVWPGEGWALSGCTFPWITMWCVCMMGSGCDTWSEIQTTHHRGLYNLYSSPRWAPSRVQVKALEQWTFNCNCLPQGITAVEKDPSFWTFLW